LRGEGHGEQIPDPSKIREFHLTSAVFDYRQNWWTENAPKFCSLEYLSVVGQFAAATAVGISSLRILEISASPWTFGAMRMSPSGPTDRPIEYAIRNCRSLETLIINEGGRDYLPAVVSNPSIRNFSAFFSSGEHLDAVNELYRLGSPHIRLFARRQTFLQSQITNTGQALETLTKFHKAFQENKHASLDPTLYHLFPAQDNLNTALEVAIANDEVHIVDFLLNKWKIAFPASRLVPKPIEANRAVPLPSAEIDWGLLELAVFEMSTPSLHIFLGLLPASVVVTSSTLSAIMLIEHLPTRLQKLKDVLHFARSRGPGGFDFNDYIKFGRPNTLLLRPIHNALLQWSLVHTAQQTVPPPQHAIYLTILDFLQSNAADSLVSVLDEAVFPAAATALHLLCASNSVDATQEIERLIKLGCNIYARDKSGAIPLEIYLRNRSAPWLPSLSPPVSDLMEFLPETGDFRYAVFKYPRPQLEPLLQHIAPADKESSAVFWRNIFRSPSHPDVVKYLLFQKWELSIPDLVSQFSLSSLASVAIPRETFTLAAESLVEERNPLQHPRPSDPLLAILFRLDIPFMKTPAYGRKLLRCLNLEGVSGVLLSLFESHGFTLSTSEDEIVDIVAEYSSEMCVVEYLLNHLPVERRIPALVRIIPVLQSKHIIQHVVRVLQTLVVAGWHAKEDIVQVSLLLEALFQKLSMWTVPNCNTPEHDFWTELRANRLGNTVEELLTQSGQTHVDAQALVVAVSAGTSQIRFIPAIYSC
jgi:hypothetical protein